ncbi:MAG: tandem-95 repeat protein, partial [Desulfobulbaceae bacterium]|nr:tandem-95 repeat protein [Desulfobulbaceae bacterium]
TTINVDPVNDAPTLNLDGDDSSGAGGNNYSFTFTEGDVATNIADTDTVLADVDNTTFASVSLNWSVLTDGDSERMVLDGSTFNLGTTVGATDTTGGNYTVTVTADTGADTAAVTITKQGGGTFSQVEVETLVEAIQYQHADGDNPIDGNRTVDISVSDGALSSAVATTTINVDPVNDAPTFAALDDTPTFTEDDPAVVLDMDATVADIELDALNGGNGDYSGATLTLLRNGGADSDDIFAHSGNLGVLSEGGNIDLSGTVIGTVTTNSSGTLLLTFNSNATSARVDEVLQSITYANNSDSPPANVQIDYTFSDGNAGAQGSGGALTATGSITATITSVNDAPVFAGLDATPTFTENGAAVVLDGDATISDGELDLANNYNGSTLTLIRNGGANPDDVFANSGNLSVLTEGGNLILSGVVVGTVTTNSNGTLLLTFNNNATSVRVDEVLRSISYSNSSDNPPATVQVDYTFDDQNAGAQGTGGAKNDTGSIILTVISTNDSPSATNLTTTSAYAEDALSVAITDIVVTDPDTGEVITATLTLQNVNTGVLSANDGASYSTVTGVWTITDTVANVNTALAGVVFQPATNNDLDTTITVNIADGGEDGAVAQTGTITLDVTPAPDVPTSAVSSANVIQNITYTFLDTDFNFSDVDTGDSLGQVRITSLPAAGEGTLILNSSAVAANDLVNLADIVAGNFVFTPVADFTGASTFDFTVLDNTGLESIASYVFTVNVINANAPVVTAGNTLNYTEKDPASVIDPTIFVSDNSDEITSAVISISSGFVVGEDQLGFTDTADIAGSWNGGTGELTLTSVSGTASVAAYQAALRSITYVNLKNNPTAGNRVISITVTDNDIDGPYTGASANSVVAVTTINDAPIISAGGMLSYTEDDAATAIDAAIDIADVDSITLSSATVTISSGYINGQDVLAFTNTANITGTWDAATGVLTLTGVDTVVAYRNALRNVTYENSETANPFAGSRTISFQVNDGADNSLPATSTITVSSLNDPPTVTAGATLNYTEADPATVIDGTIVIGDVDSTTINGAIIRITAGFKPLEDVLAFSNTANITGSWDGAGTLTLTGTDTLAAYQAALRTVTYENTNSVNPATSSRTISFEVNDGTDSSVPSTSTVNISGVNNLPTISGGTSVTFTEGDSAMVVDSTITLADNDNTTLAGATITIGTGYVNGEDVLAFSNTANITGTWTAATGVLSLTGTDTIAAYQAALRTITFDNTVAPPANPTSGTRTVSFIVNDGTDNSLALTSSVDVQAIDDAPTASNMSAAESFTEGDGAFGLTGIVVSDIDSANVTATLTLSDPAAGSMSTGTSNAVTSTFVGGVWTASGALADVNVLLGSITFTPVADYDQNFTIDTAVSDGTTTITGSKVVTVTPQDDAPGLAVNAGLTANEGETVVLDNTMLQTTDVDTGANLTYTLDAVPIHGFLEFTDPNTLAVTTLNVGDTFTQAQIDAGNISYRHDGIDPPAPNDSFDFSVDDGVGGPPLDIVGKTFTINVTAVNDIPTSLDNAVTTNEDTAYTFVVADFNYSDAEGDAFAQIKISSLVSGGTLQLNGADVALGDVISEADIALGKLIYTPAADGNGAGYDSFNFQVHDGTDFSTDYTMTVDVTAVNDAPVLDTGASHSLTTIPENDTTNNGDSVASIIADGSITDVDTSAVKAIAVTGVDDTNGTWQYSTDGGSNWNDINDGSLAANHALLLDGSDSDQRIRFVPDADYYGSPTLTFQAWDKTSGTAGTYADASANGGITPFSQDSDTATIRVNDIPELSGGSSLTFTENGAAVRVAGLLTITDNDDSTLDGAVVAISSGYDRDHDILNYGLSGGVTGSWDAGTGVLTFSGTATKSTYQDILRSITFESLGDDVDGGSRTISFAVNDGLADSDAETSTVTVIPVNDAPEVTGGEEHVYENLPGDVPVAGNLTLSDPDLTSINSATVTISGGYVADQDELVFADTANITGSWDAETGVLTFSGEGSVTEYEEVLRRVSFNNSETFPEPGPRTITFVVNDGELDSAVISSTIDVIANMPVPSDQALQPVDVPPVPVIPPHEMPGAIIDGILSDAPFKREESVFDELEFGSDERLINLSGASSQFDKFYGGESPLSDLAGLSDKNIEAFNREVDRLLEELSDENLPLPPELLLDADIKEEVLSDEHEGADEKLPDSEDGGDEKRKAEEQQLDKEGVEPGEEAGEELLSDEPAAKAPAPAPPAAVAPGLAAQISAAAESFEKNRQELLADEGEKGGKQSQVDQKVISETFNEVFELLQCQ